MNDDIIRLSRMTGASEAKARKVYEEANGDFYSALGRLQAEGFDGQGFTNPGPERTADNNNPVNKFLSSYVTLNTLRLPLIVAALGIVFGFPYVVPIVIIAMICKVRFGFEGPIFDNKGVAAARQTANEWKNSAQSAWQQANASYQSAWQNSSNNNWQNNNGNTWQNNNNNAWQNNTRNGQGSVQYQMPPKYEYENAYAGSYGYGQDSSGSEFGEEKGFF